MEKKIICGKERRRKCACENILNYNRERIKRNSEIIMEHSAKIAEHNEQMRHVISELLSIAKNYNLPEEQCKSIMDSVGGLREFETAHNFW